MRSETAVKQGLLSAVAAFLVSAPEPETSASFQAVCVKLWKYITHYWFVGQKRERPPGSGTLKNSCMKCTKGLVSGTTGKLEAEKPHPAACPKSEADVYQGAGGS